VTATAGFNSGPPRQVNCSLSHSRSELDRMPSPDGGRVATVGDESCGFINRHREPGANRSASARGARGLQPDGRHLDARSGFQETTVRLWDQRITG
jgi:hypothetical protein